MLQSDVKRYDTNLGLNFYKLTTVVISIADLRATCKASLCSRDHLLMSNYHSWFIPTPSSCVLWPVFWEFSHRIFFLFSALCNGPCTCHVWCLLYLSSKHIISSAFIFSKLTFYQLTFSAKNIFSVEVSDLMCNLTLTLRCCFFISVPFDILRLYAEGFQSVIVSRRNNKSTVI